ncbi:MAG TPA: ATP-binding protein, partial [Pseudonocardiaceae bacterium]
MPDFPPGNKHARWVEPTAGSSAGDTEAGGARPPAIAHLAVLPALAMAVLGAAAAVLLAMDHSMGMVVGVLIGGVLCGGLVLGWGASRATATARTVHDQVSTLILTANEVQGAAGAAHRQLAGLQQLYAELQRAYETAVAWPVQFAHHIDQFAARVARGERPSPHDPSGGPTDDRDPFARLDRAHRAVRYAAESAIVAAAEPDTDADPAQRLQVFANLGRRLQSLVNREIQMLDELENQIEDPEILEGIFAVDHLATRIRRQAENLGVLGGARAPRQWTKPLTMVTTLRSAMQEVEYYKRVKMVSPINGTLRGHNVTEIIHLLAELIENATAFSDPDTTVMLSAQNVTAGLAIEVEDRGLGIKVEDLERINNLLSGPEISDVGVLLSDGRQIGLWVVAQLARRNDVKVRLARNIFGGTTAAVVVPHSLLGDVPELVTAPRNTVPPEPYDEPVADDRSFADLDLHRWPDRAGELAVIADVPDVPEMPEMPAVPEVAVAAEAEAVSELERPPLPKRQPGTNHL